MTARPNGEARRVVLALEPLDDGNFEVVAYVRPPSCLTAEEKAAMTEALETCVGAKAEALTTRPLLIARTRRALPPDVLVEWAEGPKGTDP